MDIIRLPVLALQMADTRCALMGCEGILVMFGIMMDMARFIEGVDWVLWMMPLLIVGAGFVIVQGMHRTWVALQVVGLEADLLLHRLRYRLGRPTLNVYGGREGVALLRKENSGQMLCALQVMHA